MIWVVRQWGFGIVNQLNLQQEMNRMEGEILDTKR